MEHTVSISTENGKLDGPAQCPPVQDLQCGESCVSGCVLSGAEGVGFHGESKAAVVAGLAGGSEVWVGIDWTLSDTGEPIQVSVVDTSLRRGRGRERERETVLSVHTHTHMQVMNTATVNVLEMA